MNTKLVYLFDPTTLEYAGEMNAQENPVNTGTYILPLYYTETWPGKIDPAKKYIYSAKGDSWDIVPIPVEVAPTISVEDQQAKVAAEQSAALDAIIWGQLPTILDYIANQADAPRSIKDAKQQLAGKRITNVS